MLDSIRPKKSTIYLYLLIPVALFIFTVFFPLVSALVYSFFEWKRSTNFLNRRNSTNRRIPRTHLLPKQN